MVIWRHYTKHSMIPHLITPLLFLASSSGSYRSRIVAQLAAVVVVAFAREIDGVAIVEGASREGEGCLRANAA
ncbi:hypothetical protein B0J18DRAFT_421175 [Chaetomium sp. MPI-SDFR-AT-0129]|nr:hypothetical protein B0J18DRAFT_421175 [Chaetomium sp. MPI-SDFR-AT-0129]